MPTPRPTQAHANGSCGDGVVAFPEQCDDGALAAGDGCSATCKIEVGFKCAGAPSACSATTCGDGKIEGAETCDDGNSAPLDGCSPSCVGEPDCAAGACVSACGDDAKTVAKLELNGDDDFWVFLNGKLALDLGGVHSTQPGQISIDASAAAALSLEDGKVYQIKIFHAERQSFGSTFKLTLSGFSTSRSDCNAKCGDGIIGAGEECDDGVNDGGYNECQAGCKLGPYCGDGVVDAGEDCDDGNRQDGDGCGSACRHLVVK